MSVSTVLPFSIGHQPWDDQRSPVGAKPSTAHTAHFYGFIALERRADRKGVVSFMDARKCAPPAVGRPSSGFGKTDQIPAAASNWRRRAHLIPNCGIVKNIFIFLISVG